MSGSTSRRLAGILSAFIDGTVYNVTEGTWSPSRHKRETLTSLSGVDGFSETPVAGHIQLKIRDARNIAVRDFNDMADATVVVQLANGKTVSGNGLWVTEAQEVSLADATFDVRFEGDDVGES